jgi:hypothetical protein
MVPQILYRICHRNEQPHPDLVSHLRFTPALLRNYSRRKVLFADYPGIIAQKSHTVLGTLISGLSDTDVRRLDFFEGSMYERVVVEVEALEAEVFDGEGNINDKEMEKVKASEEGERKMVKAETYVWCLSEGLEEEEWSFADFRREKMKDWVCGQQSDGSNDYYDDTDTEEESQNGDGKSALTKTEKKEGSKNGDEESEMTKTEKEVKHEGGGDEEDEEQEKRRIASVVAGIAAEEAEAGESEMLRSAV